jgi:two-component system response regulator HydG
LTAIDDKKIKKVGATNYIKIDCRVIAATNQNLPKLIEDGKFLEDLFYRLDEITFVMPSLQERGSNDKFEIAKHLIKIINKEQGIEKYFDSSAEKFIKEYDWGHGEIRQMRNVILKAHIFSGESELISRDDLDKYIIFKSNNYVSYTQKAALFLEKDLDYEKYMKEFEIKLVEESLKRTHGNRSKAAKILKLVKKSKNPNYSQAVKKICERLGIDYNKFKE